MALLAHLVGPAAPRPARWWRCRDSPPAVSVPPRVLPAFGVTLAVWTSIRSTSVNAIVPLSVRSPAGVAGFGHRAGDIGAATDRRIVVGAGDGDGDRAVNVPPLPSERDGERLDLGLVRRQILDVRRRRPVGPGQHAARPVLVVVERSPPGCQSVPRGAGVRRHAGGVDVGQVDVGERDRAAVGQVAGRRQPARSPRR